MRLHLHCLGRSLGRRFGRTFYRSSMLRWRSCSLLCRSRGCYLLLRLRGLGLCLRSRNCLCGRSFLRDVLCSRFLHGLWLCLCTLRCGRLLAAFGRRLLFLVFGEVFLFFLAFIVPFAKVLFKVAALGKLQIELFLLVVGSGADIVQVFLAFSAFFFLVLIKRFLFDLLSAFGTGTLDRDLRWRCRRRIRLEERL